MKSQLASPTFTPTYAALIAIINTKFPEIGELLLKRVISQVGMHGSLCLWLFAHLHVCSLSMMHLKVSLMPHKSMAAWLLFLQIEAWHDCAFQIFFVIAVLKHLNVKTRPQRFVYIDFQCRDGVSESK